MDNKETARVEIGTSETNGIDKFGLLQILRGEDVGREFELKPGNNLIGRQDICHIKIVNKTISRRHAQIVVNPEAPADSRHVIYDLQSTNGVRVNGELTTGRPLRDGDRVQFGSVVCKFSEIDSIERDFLKEIKKLIEYDRRTELLQIKPFYERLQNELQDAETQNRPMALLMMDLDGLKRINDAHGHLAGTFVIEKIAQILNSEISASGVAAIYGGDEFTAYLQNSTRNEAAEHAEHIRELVENLDFSEKNIKDGVTISIGVAEYPTDASEMMQLVSNADRALMTAKTEGKNRVVEYNPSMSEPEPE